MEFDKKVIVEPCGNIQNGKEFDLELTIPEDNRSIISGIIKDSKGFPIKNAVVKLIEITKNERKPVTHTLFDDTLSIIF